MSPFALWPAGLAAAECLVVLNVSKNQLTELPTHMVANWLSLKELDVSHNHLQVGTLYHSSNTGCAGMCRLHADSRSP